MPVPVSRPVTLTRRPAVSLRGPAVNAVMADFDAGVARTAVLVPSAYAGSEYVAIR